MAQVFAMVNEVAMQLSMFQETHTLDNAALQRCLKAEAVSVDIETDTRWPGHGPKLDYGLSYSAAVTVIALAHHLPIHYP